MKKLKAGTIIVDGEERCTNRCTFCPGHNNTELNTNQKLEKFKKDTDYFVSKGVEEIEISGNDPIQYSKIVDCVSYLSESGVKRIVISTHGRDMKDIKLTKNLAKAGLNFCRIPLYGSTGEIHNQAVQYVASGETPLSVGNAFDDAIEGIKNCADNDIFIKGHIVPMQFNQHDISATVDLYLELTSGKMADLVISSACISKVSKEYTADWYLPISQSSKTLKSVLDHKIKKDFPHIFFKILDFPFCNIGKIHEDMLNNDLVPNMGEHKVNETVRSKVDDSIPHYRIKTHFKECEKCLANKICAGIYKNDLELFGKGELQPITTESLSHQFIV